MLMLKRMAPAALILAVGIGLALVRADDQPKLTTKQVMDQVYKDNKDAGDFKLYTQVVNSNDPAASKKIGAQLVDLYTALGQNKPPKGDPDDWTKRCNALLAAAQDVADGKDGGVDELKKASDCRSCHMAHRIFRP